MENWWFQLFHWDVGVIIKLILNLILVPIEGIGVNGAAIGSVACHAVAFFISIIALKKNIKLNLGTIKFVIKPILATAIMGICSYFMYSVFLGIIGGKLATIIAIGTAVIIYVLAILVLKVFSKEEIEMLPQGTKIVKILEKLKIY